MPVLFFGKAQMFHFLQRLHCWNIYYCSWISSKYYLTFHLIMFGLATPKVSKLILRFVCAYIWHLCQYPILLFISDIRAFIWQCLPPRPTPTLRFGRDIIDRTDCPQEKNIKNIYHEFRSLSNTSALKLSGLHFWHYRPTISKAKGK